MGCWEEVQSGKFSLYGQWLGIISGLLLLIIGIATLFGFSFSFIPFAIVGWFCTFVIIMLELPICQKCCPIPTCMEPVLKMSDNNLVHACFYLLFGVIIFLSAFIGVSWFILCGIFMFFASGSYFIAMLRKEEKTTSRYTGAAGIAEVAIGVARV